MNFSLAAAIIVSFVVTGCATNATPRLSGAWLMIVPPLDAYGNPMTSEPLPKWQVVDRFSSQIDCDTILANQQFEERKRYGPIGKAQNYYESIAVRLLNGQCVLGKELQDGR
jgi:hypothetical protein